MRHGHYYVFAPRQKFATCANHVVNVAKKSELAFETEVISDLLYTLCYKGSGFRS